MSNTVESETLLIGRNPVLEALNRDKQLDKIYIKKGQIEGSLKVIAAKAKEKGIPVSEVDKSKLDEMSNSGNHQGVVAARPAVPYVELEDMLELAKSKGEDPLLVLLEGITDPHNLGAIIRTAEGAGAHGVVIPKRRACGLNSVVAKTSSGAIEHMLIAQVTNMTDTIKKLQKLGLWVACADMGGKDLKEADLSGPLAIVIGGEGSGVSRLVSEKSDFQVRIPMYGKIASLNASVAAGIIIYEAARRRHDGEPR
ncbi:MAG: 23S rRNA (guanosine(2251)-2'-O)-methyltransferase RlmB [Clostridiales bacterium]|jgi:23S rRNA (guanosine2251-2'-O)-methyltransferase|nr:23S rRNA (guanosine(2251)-2'-O)-methyltransferase RlmB [Clostridiales bacterium]MDR2752323.1 23S rRNA (guanosine(2251)-2'-O)-methyltransferase RlmB [Clostridiales bacterium]